MVCVTVAFTTTAGSVGTRAPASAAPSFIARPPHKARPGHPTALFDRDDRFFAAARAYCPVIPNAVSDVAAPKKVVVGSVLSRGDPAPRPIWNAADTAWSSWSPAALVQLGQHPAGPMPPAGRRAGRLNVVEGERHHRG